jgi:hypothetical protein
MSIPVQIEVWQTNTPEMVGSWRRTAKGVTSVENGTYTLTRTVDLDVEQSCPWLYFKWKKNGEDGWRVFRYPRLDDGKVWGLVLFTQDIIDKSVPYAEDTSSRVVMRIPIPKRPLLQSVPDVAPTYGSNVVSQRIHQLELSVLGFVGLDADVRRTALELITGFRVNVAPSLEEVDRKLRELNMEAPLPTFEGVDVRGRVHFRFRTASSDIDLYVGKDRNLEVVSRVEMQLPEKAKITPDFLMGVALKGSPVGEA